MTVRGRIMAVLAAAAAAVGFAGSAHAAYWPADQVLGPGVTSAEDISARADIQDLLAAAAEHWQRTPECPGGIAVAVMDHPNATIAAIAVVGGCQVWFNRGFLVAHDPETDGSVAVGWRCQVMVHEYGHLLGLRHDETHPVMRSVADRVSAPVCMTPAAPDEAVVADMTADPSSVQAGQRQRSRRGGSRSRRAGHAPDAAREFGLERQRRSGRTSRQR